MEVPARQPDVHLGVRIAVAAAEPEHQPFVVVRRQEPGGERAQLERDDIDAHPELLQVVLNDRRDLHPFGVLRVGDDRELDRLARRVDERHRPPSR